MDYLDQNIFLGKVSTCKKVTEKRVTFMAFVVPKNQTKTQQEFPPLSYKEPEWAAVPQGEFYFEVQFC
jgi:hypothetical protein